MRWPSSSVGLLLAFCLLSGSMWLLPTSNIMDLSELLFLALATVGSLLFFGLVLRKKISLDQTVRDWNWRLALSGAGSIGGPALLLLLGRQHFNSLMAVAAQAGVPVVVAVASSVFENGSELQETLLPGLLALAGTLLVLPVALPGSSQGWIGFGLCLASAFLTGISSVVCHREMTRTSRDTALFTVTFANALFLCTTSLLWLLLAAQRPSLIALFAGANLLALGISLVSLIAVIFLLYLLPPEALASRFVFAPLIAAVEAYALMRPSLSARTVIGALLMLVGALACLRSDSRLRGVSAMSLR